MLVTSSAVFDKGGGFGMIVEVGIVFGLLISELGFHL